MTASVGVSDHAGWAVLVTVRDGAFIDRRRIALIDDGLPVLPHHHDAQGLPADEGVALVERVRESAERRARTALDALAELSIDRIALRECPVLPATIAERITSYRAQCVADGVMYREALATAARERSWRVTWFDAKRVLADAPQALLRDTGKALGPPWQRDHRLAMAAALLANHDRGRRAARR